MAVPTKPRIFVEKIYFSEKGWRPGANQRNVIALRLGDKDGILQFGPSNYGNSCVHWRGKTIGLAKFIKALDDALPN